MNEQNTTGGEVTKVPTKEERDRDRKWLTVNYSMGAAIRDAMEKYIAALDHVEAERDAAIQKLQLAKSHLESSETPFYEGMKVLSEATAGKVDPIKIDDGPGDPSTDEGIMAFLCSRLTQLVAPVLNNRRHAISLIAVAEAERDALRAKFDKPQGDDPPVSFAALMDTVRENCTGHQATLIEDLICYHVRRADEARAQLKLAADKYQMTLRDAAALTEENERLVKELQANRENHPIIPPVYGE